MRTGPQALPAGWALAAGLSLAYIAQGLYVDRLLGKADSTPSSLIAITVQFFVIAAILYVKKISIRLPQTLSALAGTGLIFGFWIVFLISQAEPVRKQFALVTLGIILWSLAVDGHIYRHALSIKMNLGVLLAVLIFAANFILSVFVLG